jgi:hypothetical protein
MIIDQYCNYTLHEFFVVIAKSMTIMDVIPTNVCIASVASSIAGLQASTIGIGMKYDSCVD